MNGYQEAIEAAGCEVLAMNYFGGYQGEWAAIVNFEGRPGIVMASYRSCSGCDSYEAWRDSLPTAEGQYYRDPTRAELAEFGADYVKDIKRSPQEVIGERYWNSDSSELGKWVIETWAKLGLNNGELVNGK